MNKLKFAVGNSKLSKNVAIFSLPAGWSCPFAKDCKSTANRETGKLTDGKDCRFRCYAASGENLFHNIRISRWRNFEALKGKSLEDMITLIHNSLPSKQNIVRIHQSGDFFSQAYFDAWVSVAKLNPTKVFYAYTKALPFWTKRINDIPSNLYLNASKGGTRDELIKQFKLKSVEVVFSEAEAKKKGLKIDHTDTLAYKQSKSYAILLHGVQPKGSEAGKALSKLRKQGLTGYHSDYFAHYKKVEKD
jgi:hypothetical protein